ncbi:MAG: hypothetical protein AB3N28_09030 [Kordiimonas sp.]
MPAGPLRVYDSALLGMLDQTLPPLDTATLTALLLSPRHVVDLASHQILLDIKDDEISAADYARASVNGARLSKVPGGASFFSDPIHFGDPVTMGPVSFLAMVYGELHSLSDASPLLGIAELSVGGAVEAQRSRFSISAPPEGWFFLTRSN